MRPLGHRGPLPGRRRSALTPLLAVATVLVVVAVGCRPRGESEQRTVRVAVASSFLPQAERVVRRFTAATGYSASLSSGATGALAAQVLHGAPFDVLLAADAERPRRLEQAGLAVPGSRFAYAYGRLAVWGAALEDPERAAEALCDGRVRIAIADAQVAPYGAAAERVLETLGCGEPAGGAVLRAASVAQAHALVRSGAAELGIVPLPLAASSGRPYWAVPAGLHEPLRHEAVLLQAGAGKAGALAFLEFLRRPEVQRDLEAAGYRPGVTAGRAAPRSSPRR